MREMQAGESLMGPGQISHRNHIGGRLTSITAHEAVGTGMGPYFQGHASPTGVCLLCPPCAPRLRAVLSAPATQHLQPWLPIALAFLKPAPTCPNSPLPLWGKGGWKGDHIKMRRKNRQLVPCHLPAWPDQHIQR